MKLRNTCLSLLAAAILGACTANTENTEPNRAKYEPEDGEVILFIGQDLEAIGGLEKYNNGYMDHFKTPGGFTMYTNFRTGDESYGHTYRGLDGVTTTDNWGSGDCNMQMQINDPDFDNMALAIGLELVKHDSLVALGEHDDMIIELAQWVKGLGKRPVFLRIGYEFDGFSWNFYKPENYVPAFRRVKDVFDSLQVENYATVWQSKGAGADSATIARFYPGDEYVDWCGYSHFAGAAEGAQVMIDFARAKGKPVFIAEATPMLTQADTLTIDCFLGNPDHAEQAWSQYFIPFFEKIDQNPDVVKAISYINIDWYNQAMWENNPPFKHVDSRLQESEMIRTKWNKIVGTKQYLHASDTLFTYLNQK